MFYKKINKWMSLLLCVSLCAGSPAIISMAETIPAGTAYENTGIPADGSVIEEPDTGEPDIEEPEGLPSGIQSDPEPSEVYSTESNSSEESISEESSSAESTPSETSPEESVSDSISTGETTAGDEITGETTTEEFTSEEEFSGETTTEELTPEEEFSGETITEEFRTGDELLSEDTGNPERGQYIADAVDTFHALVQEKTLMALLYHTDSYQVQRDPGSYDNTVATIQTGHTLYINGVEILDGVIWYRVIFWLDGSEQTGYIESYYLAYSDEDWISWETEYLAELYPESTTYGITAYSSTTGYTDYSDISAFPAIYQDSLRALKEQHPTWTFVPMKTGLDFNTAVSNEMGAKSLIQNTSGNASKGWVGSACPTESGWYYATQPAVSYYMNPCNFLTETYIFQFEQLTFNSTYHNVNAIQTFLNNTFMNGKIPGDASNRTYAQAFYEIGKNRRLSPIHLASRVYQEQGNGTSALISGTYAGYEGYYNYFNVGVNGSSTEEKIKKGLTYAKQQGWNTRFKSLEGGASTIGNNYILKGQDTVYLEKFNVDANSPYGLYNHQYMQNIQAPASEASSTRRMYAGAGSLNSGFVFKIPVYQNMPGEKAIQSISLDKTELTLYRPDTITGSQPDMSASAVLSASITPSDTTDDTTITWTSSNPKIVSVKTGENTQNAAVTALAAGEATITAKSQNNKTAKCIVRVEAPIYSLKLTNLNAETDTSSSVTLYAGQRLTLTADYLPKDTTSDTAIVWSSSDTSIASVLGGKVTAHSEGDAAITATIAGISASYHVLVKKSSAVFMSSDDKVMKEVGTVLGETIPADDFPKMESTPDRLFIGWYTGKNGNGTRFDENTQVSSSDLVLYPYFAPQGKGFYVIPVGDYIYTGAAIKPQVQVYDSVSYADGNTELTKLVQGQDYTVTYKNNKNVNTASGQTPTITVKGKGNYSGTESICFNILPKPLTDYDISVSNISAAYNGKVQKSAPAVYRNGKKLVNKTDYTLSYPYTDSGAYKNAGVYPIVIKGTKNYTGTLTVYETISNKTLLSKVTIAKIPNQTYKNELVNKAANIGIAPNQLNVTYKNEPLIPSTDGGRTGDYTVSYTNNMAVGTATATITAVEGSAFAGSKSITYKIVGENIGKAKVEGITPKTYTGMESDVWQNNAILTLNDTLLTESMDNGVTGDYLVSYTNTAKAGTATVIFKGINEYSGQLKKTYKITGFDITAQSGDTITLSPAITMAYSTEDAPSVVIPVTSISEITSPYMKGGAKPQIKLYYNGTELASGKDYTVSYSNHMAVTTSDMAEKKLPKLTIKGKGNFKGSITGTWKITDGAMSDGNGKLTMTANDILYKNKAGNYKTTISIIDANGKKLAAGKDYDRNVTYSYVNATKVLTADGSQAAREAGEPVSKDDIVSAGTLIRTSVTGTGAYAGNGNATLSATYRVTAADIAKAKVQVAAKVYQNGREVRLDPDDVKLTLNGAELKYGTDYVIDENSYANNTKKGRATVTLRGISENYGGRRKVTYTIGSKILAWLR